MDSKDTIFTNMQLIHNFTQIEELSFSPQKILLRAANLNRTDILKACDIQFTFNYNDVSKAFDEAAKNSNYKSMSLIYSWGVLSVTFLNDCLLSAACKGKVELANSCLKLGAYDLDTAMICAAKYGKPDTLAFLARKKDEDVGSLNSINECLINAAIHGQMETVNICLELGANSHECAFEGAIQNMHIEIAKILQKYGISQFIKDKSLQHLARRGNVLGVRLLLEWGASNLDAALVQAITNGHLQICELLLYRGATISDARHCLKMVLSMSHSDNFISPNNYYSIIDYVVDYITDYEDALQLAVYYGDLKTTERLLLLGATLKLEMFKCAAKRGMLDILRVLIAFTDSNRVIENAMLCAAGAGEIEIVKFLKDEGAANLEACLCEAAKGGHLEIMDLCRVWGARQFENAMLYASSEGYLDAMLFCKIYGATNFSEAEKLATKKTAINICRLWQRNVV